jgi:hypothetical protein
MRLRENIDPKHAMVLDQRIGNKENSKADSPTIIATITSPAHRCKGAKLHNQICALFCDIYICAAFRLTN